MTIVVPVPIPAAPPVPDSGLPEPTFDAQYEAFNSYEKNALVPGMNALGDATYQNALDAKNSATTATTKAGEASGSAAAAAAGAATATTKAGEAVTNAAASAGSAATASTKAGEASSSAATAAAGAATATAKAADATDAATAAQTYRNQAEVFATQQLKASSTTNVTPGAGNQSFNIEASRSFVAGMYLVATSAGVPSTYMRGTVVSYNSTTGALTLSVDVFSGGARADWVIGVAAQGAADPASAIHAAAGKATPVDADELGLVDSAAAWGLKKLTWANLKATLLAYFQGQFRERLTAARTYYVRTDGNDNNTGLVNTAGGAFLTLQKAIDVVTGTLDLGIYNVTIQLADGTYTAATTLKPYVSGGGRPTILGNTATPANVLISTNNANCFTGFNAGWWILNGVKLQTSVSGRGIFLTGHASQLDCSNVNFGACVNEHMLINIGAVLRAVGNWAISGGAPTHVNTTAQGYFSAAAVTCTLTGTPAFTYFADCDMNAVSILQSVTFSGSATGGRYRALTNGVIQTYGGGANYLPGSTAGTVDATGVYA